MKLSSTYFGAIVMAVYFFLFTHIFGMFITLRQLVEYILEVFNSLISSCIYFICFCFADVIVSIKMTKNEYKPYDFIFAKVKGYPHWPGRVSLIFICGIWPVIYGTVSLQYQNYIYWRKTSLQSMVNVGKIIINQACLRLLGKKISLKAILYLSLFLSIEFETLFLFWKIKDTFLFYIFEIFRIKILWNYFYTLFKLPSKSI